MDFNIKDVIDEELGDLNVTLDQYYDDKVKDRIDNLVHEQNLNAVENEKYRQELIGILEHLKEMNVNVNYDPNMSVYELENLVSKFNV